MNDEEFELFRDKILDMASSLPMKICPRCNGTGKRQVTAGSISGRCFTCNGSCRIDEEQYEQYQSKAIFP